MRRGSLSGFAVGTGRCGTHFLYELMRLEKDVAASHERNTLNENFHRYCKWYRLSVDDKGFLDQKADEIFLDLQGHAFSFEASAPLSLSIVELYRRFGSKFVMLVRSPEKVVESYFKKGYYKYIHSVADGCAAPGYQKCTLFHHFLGRIAPMGDVFDEWNRLTRVGKIAWYWNTINAEILRQFEEIPPKNRMIVKLEDLDYAKYGEIVGFLGMRVTVTENRFNDIRLQTPGKVVSKFPPCWRSHEIAEFKSQVGPMAERLGYSIEEKFFVNRPDAETRGKVTVVVRSVGERTTECCRKILSEHFGKNQIRIVNASPHPVALRQCYSVAIEEKRPWLFLVDADVLPSAKGIEYILAQIENLAESVFVFSADVLDKFAGGPRPAGNHFYRTAFLADAIELIPDPEISLRPETYTIKKMKELHGKTYHSANVVVGVHDYEQSYRDIYRTGLLHSIKFADYLDIFRPDWETAGETDGDFGVLLAALREGPKHTAGELLDAGFFARNFGNVVSDLGLTEKPPLPPDAFSGTDIDRIIETTREREAFVHYMRIVEERVSTGGPSPIGHDGRKTTGLSLSRRALRCARRIVGKIFKRSACP